MAGSWLALIQGFAGMRVHNGKLTFNPRLPAHWSSLSFNVNFRGEIVHCKFNCCDKSMKNEV
jgi:trehalose/maltose hydrolase-like predicted phosphorylase